MKRALALLPMAFVLAACGGGSTGGGEAAARQAEEDIPGEEFSPEYQQGIGSCTISPLEVMAREYNVKAEPEAVARAVAKSIEPNNEKKQELVYKGCLTVLKAPGGTGG